MTKPNRDDIAELMLARARKTVKSLVKGAKIVYDPAGYQEKKLSKEEIETEINKMDGKAVMFMQQNTATQRGPVKGVYQVDELTVEVFGDDWQSVNALSSGGKQYWDVGTGERAIIGTADQIRAWLKDNGDAYIANTLLTAEVGGRSAMNTDQRMAMMFGDLDIKPHIYATSGPFTPMARRDRYNVINPTMAAVRIMSGHLESLATTGILAVADAPSEFAEQMRAVFEGVGTLVEAGGGIYELIKKDDEHVGLGKQLQYIQLSSGAGGTCITSDDGPGIIAGTKNVPGVKISDVAGTLAGMLS